MNGSLTVWVQGIGAWAAGLPDWPSWCTLLRHEGGLDEHAPASPKPARLAVAERRRVSLHVLAASEVADQAVAMSGLDAADLPCVFASAHGDAGIMDYMCAVLADTPQHLSPTRFHNSVHNAAVGYWTIASGCHAASSAIAAAQASFGAGMLEAATLALAENQPVLLVANDEPGSGPLGEVLGTTRAFACALVLAPCKSGHAVARLDLALVDGSPTSEPRHPHLRTLAQANPCARGLRLLEALAARESATVTLEATPALGLAIHASACEHR